MRLTRASLSLTGTGVVIAAALTGCAVQQAPYDLQAEDVAGFWVLEGIPNEASISMAKDGSFEAASWPANVLCAAAGANTVDEVAWDRPVDFSGTWRMPVEGSPSLLLFSTDSSACSNPTWTLQVWEVGADQYKIEVFLDSVVDPDAAGDDQVLWISKVSPDE